MKGQGVSNPFLQWVQSSSSLSDTKDRQKLRRDLFLADLASHEERINGSIAEDFPAALYASAVWRSPHTVAAE